ncbi:ankyrin repeat domain-containing protein [Flexibacterium corallicola]|uniref:ankyrin repeat domain-containing protein n=1 Tax=Flexibacterium corallicola TaxID=3037259 RepID=UPI00286FAC88|nr:ankyrin repeat domain-containing protein [Pseudovibrio sp. M1P-2-3]
MKIKLSQFVILILSCLLILPHGAAAEDKAKGPILTLEGAKITPPKAGQLIVKVHPNGCVASAWASGFLPDDRLAQIVQEHISGEEPRTQIDTDLMRAVARNNLTEVERLIAHGVNINQSNDYGCSALFWAVAFAYEDILEVLLQVGADVNQTDSVGRSPLMTAAVRGSLSMTKKLIKAGANIHHIQTGGTYQAGHTALHHAAYKAKNTNVLSYLIEHGIDINSVNKNGQTPLIRAARRGNFENMKLLLSAGANTTLIDDNNNTALKLAKRKDPIAAEKLWNSYK